MEVASLHSIIKENTKDLLIRTSSKGSPPSGGQHVIFKPDSTDTAQINTLQRRLAHKNVTGKSVALF